MSKKAQDCFYDAMSRFGCVVSHLAKIDGERRIMRLVHGARCAHPEIHHIVKGGHRKWAIAMPLCHSHHPNSTSISVAKFEKAYGSEYALYFKLLPIILPTLPAPYRIEIIVSVNEFYDHCKGFPSANHIFITEYKKALPQLNAIIEEAGAVGIALSTGPGQGGGE